VRRNAVRLALSLTVMLAFGALASNRIPFARAFAVDAFERVAMLPARMWQKAPWSSSSLSPSAAKPADAPLARADAKLVRAGFSPIATGVLGLPPSFTSADGAYDLLIHFHGNTELTMDNVGVAGVNAAVLIVNLGIGSGIYEERFASPDELRELLTRTEAALEHRGLAHPHLRRLALSSWSAGYGAILRIIENPALFDRVDAIVLLDGLHARALPESEPKAGQIDLQRVEPFVRFARAAVAGQKLFVITHSDVKPPDYAGCRETTDALLASVGVERTPGGEVPVMPALSSGHGVPKSKMIALEPRSIAHAGGLYVRGYTGETPEHHMAHLIQMATVGLPELARRLGEHP
jgi:hypothetical protein